MSDSPTTRISLLLRLRDTHDLPAWERFVSLYAPLVYGFARRKGLQNADAADIAQDVLTSVAQQMRQWQYTPERGSFRGWLFTIARNRVKNWLASAARRMDGTGGDDNHAAMQSQPDTAPEADEWNAEYARHVFHWAAAIVRQQVSEQTWQAFEMTAVEGHSATEVASQLERGLAAMQTGATLTSGWASALRVDAPSETSAAIEHTSMQTPSGGRGWTERSEGSPGDSGSNPPTPAIQQSHTSFIFTDFGAIARRILPPYPLWLLFVGLTIAPFIGSIVILVIALSMITMRGLRAIRNVERTSFGSRLTSSKLQGVHFGW